MRLPFLITLILLIGATLVQTKTWGQFTSIYQNVIQGDTPIDQAIFMGSHNSYNALRSDYTGQQRGPVGEIENQILNITEQLDYGVSFLTLDIHFIEAIEQASGAAAALKVCKGASQLYDACYGSGSSNTLNVQGCTILGFENFGNDTGCYRDYDRGFTEVLDEITTYLLSHPVFIMVYFNNLCNAQNATYAASVIQPYIDQSLAQLVYRPSDFNGTWPTSNEMVNKLNKRVLFTGFPGCNNVFYGSVPPINPIYPYNALSQFKANVCTFAGNQVPQGVFTSFFDDRTYFLPFINGPSIAGQYNENNTIDVVKCGFSVSYDGINETKVSWMIWSWEKNEPKLEITTPRSDSCIIFNKLTGKWITGSCFNAYNFCCKNSAGQFAYSSNNDVGIVAAKCPTGYAYLPPANYVENANLWNVAQANGAGCWINGNATLVAPKWVDYDAPPNSSTTTGVDYSSPPYVQSSTGISHYCKFNDTNENSTSTNPFQCDFQAYGQSIVDRSVGFIVFCVILIVLALGSCIGICVFSCKTLCKKDHYGDMEEKGLCAHMLYLIPVIVCIIGLILVIVGSGNISIALTNTETSIYNLIDRISSTRTQFQDALPQIGKYFDQVSVQNSLNTIADTIKNVKTGVDSIMVTKDQVDNGRSIATIIFAIVPLVLMLLGFLFHKCKSNCCLSFILIVSNFGVIIIAIVMVAHFALGVVEQDVCVELSRPDGLLTILRKLAANGFTGLGGLTSDTIPKVKDQICGQFAQLCNYNGQSTACDDAASGNCNSDQIDAIVDNTTVYDNGTYRNIPDCVNSCRSSNLKTLALNITQSRDDFKLIVDLLDQISVLLDGLVSGDTISSFVKGFCFTMGNALTLIYVGSAFLGSSTIASIVLLIWLSWPG